MLNAECSEGVLPSESSLGVLNVDSCQAAEVPPIEDKTALVKRERARAKKLEKQAEALTAEIENLKSQLIQKGQQQFHGSIQHLSAETPEVSKLHKQVMSLPATDAVPRACVGGQRRL